MSDLMHTHLELGLRPAGACPACDQLREDLEKCQQDVLVG